MNRLKEAKARIDDARYRYTFRLDVSKVERCFDCESIDLGSPPAGRCHLLKIAVANIETSRCPLWGKDISS